MNQKTLSTEKKSPYATPAMQQFKRFKDEHPDCILFFRMGDFYEMFMEDAEICSRVMGISLTQRSAGVPMCGMPHHSMPGYLRKMIQGGYKVAICDQLEDPKQAKGVVKRGVTRVVTPGTLTDETLLDEGKSNSLLAVMWVDGKADQVRSQALIAWVELSTGDFQLMRIASDELPDEVGRISPAEILYVQSATGDKPSEMDALCAITGCLATGRPGWEFRRAEGFETLCEQYGVKSLKGLGIEDDDVLLGVGGAIVRYLMETQKLAVIVPGERGASQRNRIAHLKMPRIFSRRDYLMVDQTSLRSLEVDKTLKSGGTEGSLLSVMRDCKTAMGKRMLRQWLCYPLSDKMQIQARQGVVGALVGDAQFLDDIREILGDVMDVGRLVGRISIGRAQPRDLVSLALSASRAGELAALTKGCPAMVGYAQRLDEFAGDLVTFGQAIVSQCVDSPPAHMREGGLIREGVDTQLDGYRELQRDSHAWLGRYQAELIEQTGVSGLKVGYNRVFGYYIELTALNKSKADPSWSRKQTLKNAERYITPELKDFEGKVLSAQDHAVAREQVLFGQLCSKAEALVSQFQQYADLVGELDVLCCFASRSRRYGYVKPQIVEQSVLDIVGGRHPVLDELLGDSLVPNDINLGVKVETRHVSLGLITGPNMAGKSTYIRTAALIALLAHTGCYVPAEKATVGLIDRIFTRIGASDELHTGQSTFMVEMTETANICNHATEKSLVILDEIGRGTSTLDGLSLAWAITEHLAQLGCRTLFATHYHEITQLPQQYENVMNLNVTVREWQEEIVFLHRIVPGFADRSYGIHVAKIAGLPMSVVKRANELLGQLEVNHHHAAHLQNSSHRSQAQSAPAKAEDQQMLLFSQTATPEHPLLGDLRALELDQITPLAAFDLLRKWRADLDQS